jgi:hypothetical protein
MVRDSSPPLRSAQNDNEKGRSRALQRPLSPADPGSGPDLRLYRVRESAPKARHHHSLGQRPRILIALVDPALKARFNTFRSYFADFCFALANARRSVFFRRALRFFTLSLP